MSDKETQKLTIMALVLMLFTSVYGFANGPRGFYLMGYSSIIWYIIAALGFFVPYAFMMAEFGMAFKSEKGGIYSWMEKSVGPRFAFAGIFMWYASYLVWMFNVGQGIWVPLSNGIFGRDATQSWTLLGLQYNQVLGILGICWILLIAFISSLGVKSIGFLGSIGGLAVWGLNIVLIACALLLLTVNHKIAYNPEGMTLAQMFLKSPNPSYQTPIMVLVFFVNAIFAFGGLEVCAGIVDKVDKPEKNFTKALIISAIVIAVGYSICILAIGVFADWTTIIDKNKEMGITVTLGNAAYVIMKELGVQVGLVFGVSPNIAVIWGEWFARYIGLSMFLALGGAFFTLCYSPLKQLIEGTPKGIWPKVMLKEKNGVPVGAFWVQAGVVVVMMLLNMIIGKNASVFFQILTYMTNVAMTIPYIFLTIAFFHFKRNTSIVKPFEIYKSQTSATIAVVVVTLVVGFANFFAIFGPVFENGKQGLAETLQYILGPVVFAGIAMLLYWNYDRKLKK